MWYKSKIAMEKRTRGGRRDVGRKRRIRKYKSGLRKKTRG